ncbi:MAG: hypothetical protein HY518_05760 [Candidatus Aenigmarchaeota archaeon]|nr:hypothetical protein [Candidatus Aenigmarchaeota archaeon]
MDEEYRSKTVKLYDPISMEYRGGALVPCPLPMREFANSLDGREMTLQDALEIIRPMARSVGGKLDVSERYDYIKFKYRTGCMLHHYRLIRFKEVKK